MKKTLLTTIIALFTLINMQAETDIFFTTTKNSVLITALWTGSGAVSANGKALASGNQISVPTPEGTLRISVPTTLNLTGLTCHGNELSGTLDLTNHKMLTGLDCRQNDSITSVDVSGLSELEYLYCGQQNLSTLNASGLTSLKSLYCNNNNLTTLDNLSGCNATLLSCGNNNLTTLDLSGCNSLAIMYPAGQTITIQKTDGVFLNPITYIIPNGEPQEILINGKMYATGDTLPNPTESNTLRFTTLYKPSSMSDAFSGWITLDGYTTPGGISGVTIDPETLTFEVNQTFALTANVAATAEATNKEVSWWSSASTVVRVSDSGVITALRTGTATINVRTLDGGFTSTCQVTVVEATDVYETRNANIKIYSVPEGITIAGVPTGETIQIYNLLGIKIKEFTVQSDETLVYLPQAGVYILQAGGKTFKVKN